MKALLLRFSSLGDVVLATSAARELKRRRPQAHVVFATKAAFAPILQGQPDIDEVWALGREGFGSLLGRVRAERFGLVLDLHSSLRSRALGALSGAPVTRWRSEGLNRRLRVSAPFLKLAEPQPEPEPTTTKQPVSPDSLQDDRILDHLEEAPSYQEEEAKKRAAGRRRPKMEDK